MRFYRQKITLPIDFQEWGCSIPHIPYSNTPCWLEGAVMLCGGANQEVACVQFPLLCCRPHLKGLLFVLDALNFVTLNHQAKQKRVISGNQNTVYYFSYREAPKPLGVFRYYPHPQTSFVMLEFLYELLPVIFTIKKRAV